MSTKITSFRLDKDTEGIANILGVIHLYFEFNLESLTDVDSRVIIQRDRTIKLSKENWDNKEWTEWDQATAKPSFEVLYNSVERHYKTLNYNIMVSNLSTKLSTFIKSPVTITGLAKQVQGHTPESITNIANIIIRNPTTFPAIYLSDVDGEHISLSTMAQAQQYHDTLMYRSNSLHNVHEAIERAMRKIFENLEKVALDDEDYQDALDAYDTEMATLDAGVDAKFQAVITSETATE